VKAGFEIRDLGFVKAAEATEIQPYRLRDADSPEQ
jgi:hypothetical protein